MGRCSFLQRWSLRAARLVCAGLLVTLTASGSCYVSASTCFCEGDWCGDDCNTCSDSFCSPRCPCDVRQPLKSKSKQPLAIRGYERHAVTAPDGSPRELLRAVDGPSMSPYQVALAAERRAFVQALVAANPELFGAGPFVPLGDSSDENGAPWVTLLERADGEPVAILLDVAGRIVEVELPARSLQAVELPAGLAR